MSKKAKKETAKPKAKAPKAPAPKREAKAKPEAPQANLGSLREDVLTTKGMLEQAVAESAKVQLSVRNLKREYRQKIVLYRDACRRAGTECEFGGGRAENVSGRIQFEVTKAQDGIRVEIKGKPDTAEVIPIETVRASIGKAAYAYTEKHLGPRNEIGNKGGTLANRLRAAIAA